MVAFARCITVVTLIAALISAAPAQAMAQWVSEPAATDDVVAKLTLRGNAYDLGRPDFGPPSPDFDFEPLRAPEPDPPGAFKLFQIPNPHYNDHASNVLVLPQVIDSERKMP